MMFVRVVMNANNNTKPAAGQSLFLIEFCTTGPKGETGWDINHAWVFAADRAEAERKLKVNQGKRFDAVITCNQQIEIFPLRGEFRVNTKYANLFIIR